MVVIGGGVIGTSAAFHLAEAGVDVVAARARPARQRLDQPGRRRRPRPVLRRAEHPARPAQPGRVSRLRPAAGLGDRLQAGRLPVRAHATSPTSREFERSVALQNELRRAVADADAPPRPASLCPLLEGDDILAGRVLARATATLTPEARRAGLRVRRARPRRRHPRRLARCSTSRPAAARSPAVVTEQGTIADRHRDLRRRRLVAPLRRDGRRRPARDPAAAPDPVHRGDRRAARRICR